jgi:serine/threonine-protein kinase
MATVYLAHDLREDREVAIKVLNPDLSATIGADRFEREIKIASRLQHPHILGCYESGSSNGLLYYVMPFVKGESVRDRLNREGQLPVADAVRIIR